MQWSLVLCQLSLTSYSDQQPTWSPQAVVSHQTQHGELLLTISLLFRSCQSDSTGISQTGSPSTRTDIYKRASRKGKCCPHTYHRFDCGCVSSLYAAVNSTKMLSPSCFTLDSLWGNTLIHTERQTHANTHTHVNTRTHTHTETHAQPSKNLLLRLFGSSITSLCCSGSASSATRQQSRLSQIGQSDTQRHTHCSQPARKK